MAQNKIDIDNSCICCAFPIILTQIMPLRLQEICKLTSGGGQGLVSPLPPTLHLLSTGLTTLQLLPTGWSVVRFGAVLPPYPEIAHTSALILRFI